MSTRRQAPVIDVGARLKALRPEPPLEGDALDALVATDALRSPVAAAPPATAIVPAPPAAIVAEGERAKAAGAKGNRYIFAGERSIRITVDLAPKLHKALKQRCLDEDREVRSLVIEGLAAIGIVEP